MNAMLTSERRWLKPTEERTGSCRCAICTEKPYTTFYSADIGPVCADCAEGQTVCLDFDDPMECTDCGRECDEWITLIGEEALCPDCLYERRSQ